MEEQNEINELGDPQRPYFLTALCILTFISAGSSAFSSLMTPMFQDVLIEFVNINPSFDESIKTELITVLGAGWGYYFSTFLLSGASFVGALLMWNLKKVGFHFYALSNLLQLFLPTVFLGMTVNFGNILFTSSFIALYAMFLKLMK